jgi:hypothetical protein
LIAGIRIPIESDFEVFRGNNMEIYPR